MILQLNRITLIVRDLYINAAAIRGGTESEESQGAVRKLRPVRVV